MKPAVVLRNLLLIASLLSLAGCGSDSSDEAIMPSGGDFSGSTAAPDFAADGRPLTIPALRQWQAAGGQFRMRSGARIVAASGELRPVAEVLADDLEILLGGPVPVAVATPPGVGDIVLRLGENDARLGNEGYRLNIDESVTLSAITPRGVFYGTRSLLQMLGQSLVIQAGEALDWPRYEERGLMVDIGRKYFTAEWLQRHVKELAWLKMNELHLHFSDNEGFRIESEAHPEIVSGQHLTKDEVRALVELADRYFIRILPELDMPGHLTQVLTPYPQYRLTNVFGQSNPALLDITNPEATAFARGLIEEFLPLFPSEQWHTGGDEYIGIADYLLYPQLQQHARAEHGAAANGKDAVHDFLNDTAAMLAENGRITRAWQDDLGGGSAVTVNQDIVVEWWTNFSPLGDLVLVPGPQALLDAGHKIINSGWFPTYYVVGGAFGLGLPVPATADMAQAYENWEVHQFYGPLFTPDIGGITVFYPPSTVDPDEPNLLGSKLNVWSDRPDAETEDEVAANIAPRLRVIAQKTWNSARLTENYADFQPVMQAVGSAPGF